MFNLDINDNYQTACPVSSGVHLMSLADSKSLSKKSQNVTAEDGKVNTTLPAKSLEKERKVSTSPGNAKWEANDFEKDGTNERRQTTVVFIEHSDTVELSENESSELPEFISLPFFGSRPEIPEIRSSNWQKNDDVMFLGDSNLDHASEEFLDKFWSDTPPEFATTGH